MPRRPQNNFGANQHQAWQNRTGQAVITTRGGANTIHPSTLANSMSRGDLTIHYRRGTREQVHQHGDMVPHQTAQGGSGPNRHRALSPATRRYF